jgi:hypothetical protein
MQRIFEAGAQTALNVCGCGRFHFTYGPLTLHFEPREFLLFAADVAELVKEIGEATTASRTDSQRVCH